MHSQVTPRNKQTFKKLCFFVQCYHISWKGGGVWKRHQAEDWLHAEERGVFLGQSWDRMAFLKVNLIKTPGTQTEKGLTHGTTVKRPPPGVIARILIVLGARFGGRKGSWIAHIHVPSKEALLEGGKKQRNKNKHGSLIFHIYHLARDFKQSNTNPSICWAKTISKTTAKKQKPLSKQLSSSSVFLTLYFEDGEWYPFTPNTF